MTSEARKFYPLLDDTSHPHACILFDDIAHYRKVASRYILDGLRGNDKCMMAIDRYQRSFISEDFAELGHDLEYYLSLEKLTLIDVTKSYSGNGGFDPAKTVRIWQKETEKAVSQGYDALRVTGEATFALDSPELFEKLIYYENNMNQDLFPYFPFKSLCVYDKLLYPPDIIKEAIRAHPILFYNDEMFLHNIHYVPPNIHFQTDNQANEIDIWLDNVRQNNANIQAMYDNEAKFRGMFDKAPMSYQSLDAQGNFLEVNDLWLKTFGYERNEVVGRNFSEFLASGWREHFKKNFPRFKAVGEILGVEFEMKKKDGSLVLVSFHGKIDKAPDNTFRRTHCVLQDITEAREIEEQALQQTRAITLNNRIATTFLNADGKDVFVELLGHILAMTESSYGYVGYINDNGDLFCPTMTRDIWHECDVAEKDVVFPRENWNGLWGRSLLEKETLVTNENLNTPAGHIDLECAIAAPIIHRDVLIGQFVIANKTGGYDSHDIALMNSAADQTAPILSGILQEKRRELEKEELENQYFQAQKMESIGRLAGGVAHDLNNLLGPILGYGELLLESINKSDPRHDSAKQIIAAANRAADLIRQLLTFSRKQTVNARLLNLNDLITNFHKLLRRTIRGDIEIQMVLADDLATIKGDPGQLEQILMNLLVNAQDAISSGGTIVIETSTTDLPRLSDQHQKAIPSVKSVLLAITDSGIGMEKATIDKMYEPFFTTKEKDKGTGLGLATVYGIVKQHNGHIQVESTPLEGTRFKIYFPATEEEIEHEKQSDSPLQSKHGTETILLVEDSEYLLNMTKIILERQGYQVLSARTGVEALNIIRSNVQTIDLLLTDVIMPEMNGDQLVRETKQLCPNIAVLLMSGYADEILTNESMINDEWLFIQKPYSTSNLLSKIRHSLDLQAGNPS